MVQLGINDRILGASNVGHERKQARLDISLIPPPQLGKRTLSSKKTLPFLPSPPALRFLASGGLGPLVWAGLEGPASASGDDMVVGIK